MAYKIFINVCAALTVIGLLNLFALLTTFGWVEHPYVTGSIMALLAFGMVMDGVNKS